jgi:hypothetical protein
MQLEAIGALISKAHPHNGAAARHLGFDDLARLRWHTGRQQGPGQATIGCVNKICSILAGKPFGTDGKE